MSNLNDVRSFPELLNRYLARRKLSGNQFSKLAGSSQSHVSACVLGKSAPAANKLKKWASLLDLSEQEAAEFVASGRRYKVLTNLDSDLQWIFEEIVAEFEAENAMTAALLGRIAAQCADHLPHDLVQEIAALQGALKPSGE